MADPAVFLDRDGTIIEETHYLDSIDRIRFIPGAIDAVARLKRAGFKVFGVTNQSGVARGFFPESFVGEAHRFIDAEMEKGEARLDAWYYCPHHPEASVPEYKKECGCRKPGTGMIRQAAGAFDLDLPASYMVGDHGSDIGVGVNAGFKSVFLKTGHGPAEWAKRDTWAGLPDHVAATLVEAADWILKDSGRG